MYTEKLWCNNDFSSQTKLMESDKKEKKKEEKYAVGAVLWHITITPSICLAPSQHNVNIF